MSVPELAICSRAGSEPSILQPGRDAFESSNSFFKDDRFSRVLIAALVNLLWLKSPIVMFSINAEADLIKQIVLGD